MGLPVVDAVLSPTLTLAAPLNSDISNVTAADIKTVTAGPLTVIDLIQTPAVALAAPLSVYIRTSDANIASVGGGGGNVATQSTQSWYFS